MLLALVVTSLATLAAATLVAVPPLERRVQQDQVDALRELARTVRPALRTVAADDRGPRPVLRLAQRLQRRAGGRIVVYDRAGRTLADTATAAGRMAPVPRPARTRALARRPPDGVIAGERDRVAFAVIAAGNGPARLTLVIAKALDDSRAAAAVGRSALPLALAAGLTVALALALLLSRSVLRRLGRLEADARALGTAGLSHRIAVTGTDEVSVVARALEETRGRLVEERAARHEFVATASHELRTPLASLQATLELIKEEQLTGSTEPSVIVGRVDTALRQTRRLVALATDLLDLSRVDSAAPPRLEPLELGQLSRTIARELVARLAADGRSLDVRGGPALALADPAAAARILRILLDNAVNYGRGAVIVTVAAEDDRVLAAVEDDGPGLAPDEAERVFRRFARGRAAAGTPGARLGLAIARGLAQSMGGHLVARPVARGARFVLTLCPAPTAADGADHEDPTRSSCSP